MVKLITGGTGYIGAELAHILVDRGEEVVLFDITVNNHRIEDIKNKVKVVQGDLGDFSEVRLKQELTIESRILGALAYSSECERFVSRLIPTR